MSVSPLSPRGGFTLQPSSRRLLPAHLPVNNFLIVLSPKSRERINNKAQGRVSEKTSFPPISDRIASSSTRTQAAKWSNSPQSRVTTRFNEQLVSPRSKKPLKKIESVSRLDKPRALKHVCTQMSQTDFPMEGCEPWREEDLEYLDSQW